MQDCLTPKCEFFILSNTNYSKRTLGKKIIMEQDVLGSAIETKILLKTRHWLFFLSRDKKYNGKGIYKTRL